MIRTLTFLCGTFLLSIGVQAAVLAPHELIDVTVHEVLEVVRKDKDMQAGDQTKIRALMDAKILPHFNFERMTKLAVGKAWRTATAEQKQALTSEFRTLLVRTYATTFTKYRNQTIEVKPPKLDAAAEEVTINTLIINPGSKQPILVDYDMQKTPEGWKVYDLTVEGVSLVTSYRSTFAEQVQQSGIEGLLKMLVDKNQAATMQKADAK